MIDEASGTPSSSSHPCLPAMRERRVAQTRQPRSQTRKSTTGHLDYPAGMAYGRLPEVLWPDSGLGTASVGESVEVGADNLEA